MADVLKGGRTIIGYTYDMGDDWAHKLVVSNRRPADDQVSYLKPSPSRAPTSGWW